MTIIEAGTTIPQETQLQPFSITLRQSQSLQIGNQTKFGLREATSFLIEPPAYRVVFIIYTLEKYSLQLPIEWPTKREELAELDSKYQQKEIEFEDEMIKFKQENENARGFSDVFLKLWNWVKGVGELISTFIVDNKLMSLLVLIAILCGFFFSVHVFLLLLHHSRVVPNVLNSSLPRTKHNPINHLYILRLAQCEIV